MLKPVLLSLALALGVSQVSIAQDQSQETDQPSVKSGYFHSFDVNFNKAFLTTGNYLLAGIHTTHGYNFTPGLSAGLGIGVEQEIYENLQRDTYETGNIYLPVFTDVKIYLTKGTLRPFISQVVGYTFCVYQEGFDRHTRYNNQLGGIMANPNFGFKINLGQNTAFNISICYRFEEDTTKNIFYNNGQGLVYYNGKTYKFSGNANYLTIKTGLTF